MGKKAATEVPAGAEGANSGEKSLFRASRLASASSKKRLRILKGMLEVAGSAGYREASVPSVLAHTRLSRGAFYDNFADKHQCYLTAFQEGVERLEARAVKAAVGEESWRGRMRLGLRALCTWLEAEPDIGRGLVVEVHAVGSEALEMRDKAMERVADFIDLARGEAGELGAVPGIAAEGVVGGIHAVVYSRLATGSVTEIRELLPDFIYFAVLPYFGSEVANDEMQAVKERLG